MSKYILLLIVLFTMPKVYSQFDSQHWENSTILNAKLKERLDKIVILDTSSSDIQQGLFFVKFTIQKGKFSHIELDSAGVLTSFGSNLVNSLFELSNNYPLKMKNEYSNNFILPVVYTYSCNNKSNKTSSAKEILDNVPTVDIDSLITNANANEIKFQLNEKQLLNILKFPKGRNIHMDILPVYYYSNLSRIVI